MRKQFRILVIIPKVNRTEIAVFLHRSCMYKYALIHERSFDNESIIEEESIVYRAKDIINHLLNANINISKIDAISTIGGILKAVEGGTYLVTDEMIDDLTNNYGGKHISNIGGLIAKRIADELNIHAYIVDPPVVDELDDIARKTGVPSIERKSVFHALNQRVVARFAAQELKLNYEEANFIVCHLGTGISIGAHRAGKVVDVNNGLHGDGPFSIERAGTLPIQSLVDLCYSGKYTKESLLNKLTFSSGLKAYYALENIDEVLQKILQDEPFVDQAIQAMAYQIIKEIGAMSAVLNGRVDGIVLTGPLCKSDQIVQLIMDRVSWISDLFVYPGEYDLQALHESTLRVLQEEEKAKQYSSES